MLRNLSEIAGSPLCSSMYLKNKNTLRRYCNIAARANCLCVCMYVCTCPSDVSYETSPVVFSAGSKARAAALEYKDTSAGLSPNFFTCVRVRVSGGREGGGS